MKKIGFILLSTIALVFSCKKQEEEKPQPETPKIEIPAESQSVFSQGISFGENSSSKTLSFTTTAAWSTEITDTKASSWLSVQPASGSAGKVTMTVSAPANPGREARSASVTIKCGSVSQRFNVTQSGVPVVHVESVTLDKPSLALTEGDQVKLTATVKPDNATDKTVTWTTSDASVATVEAGLVKALKPGSATITAKADGKEATCAVTVSKKVIDVTEVTLSETTLSLVEGEEATLTATVKPDDATDKTVTWSTSDAAVATVEDGKVKALKAGSATITAKAGEKEASCKVTVEKKVIPVTGITLDKTTLSLTKGQTETLSATVLPADADDPTVKWTSSNKAVATVEDGKVTAVKSGTATITAKAGSITATCAVTVTTPVESITLDRSSVLLEEGKTVTLSATVLPADADDKKVTWTSSNEEVATVSNGKISAVKEGTATITAKAGEQTATCAVTVQKKVVAVTGVSLNKTKLSLVKGQSETLSATVKPDDATDKSVTWTTSNPEVATVDENGKVTAMGGGSATVKARAGEKEAACSVTVTVPVESVSLDQTSVTLEEGQQVTLVPTIAPADATDTKVSWSSSSTSVARVDSNGKVTAVKAGSATITATVGGKSATCAVTVTKAPVPATSVTLNKSSLELFENDTETLKATVTPSNTTDVLEWSSSQPGIASVSSGGVVTALSEGTAVITAKAGEKEATCTVTVKKVIRVTEVTLNKTSLDLTKGQSEQLTAVVVPDDATYPEVTWTTGNSSVATVDQTGKVTAKGGGTTSITATADGKSATCTVTVTVPVTGVSLNKATLTLDRGASETLVATVAPADASDKTVTWESDHPEYVSVDQNGKVTAVAKGTATVKAKAGGYEATCVVTVNVPVDGITLDQTTLSLEKGGSVTLVATVTPSDATDPKVTWSSSNTAVATVDQTGKVTAVGGGSATITATAGGKSATCTVTVTVPVTGVSLSQVSLDMQVGGSAQLTATITPSDATNKKITWSSGSTAIATVDANGKVTAVAVGSTTITVTTEDGGKTATCAVTVMEVVDDNTEGYGEGNGQWD